MRLILCLATSALIACGSDPEPSSTSTTVTVNGMTRTFRLVVPSTPPQAAMPLVLAFHGGGGRDIAYPQESQFGQLAEQEGFVIAYPLAEAQAGNEGEWQLNTTAQTRYDMDFLEALIDQLSAQHNIDANRIYATGYSLGSMFAYELPCQLSNRFAAIASHAGTMPVNPTSCTPTEPMGILHLHGTTDTIIPYGSTWDWKAWDSVGTMRDIPSLIEFWRTAYNCSEQSQTATNSSQHIVHEGCDGNVRVEHHQITGLGHDWPDTINGVSTHQVVWNFLSEFSKSTP